MSEHTNPSTQRIFTPPMYATLLFTSNQCTLMFILFCRFLWPKLWRQRGWAKATCGRYFPAYSYEAMTLRYLFAL